MQRSAGSGATRGRSEAAPPVVRHRVGGEWVDSDRLLDDLNPASPGEIVARFPRGDAALVRGAVEAAEASAPAWRATPAPRRGELLASVGQLLAERAEGIARELAREAGKTIGEARGEVERAASIFRYYAGRTMEPVGHVFESLSAGRLYTLRQPLGVVGVVTPWNFPIAIPAWKIAPAIAYGNTVVWKPASATPLVAHRLMEALVEAGLPAGVVNVVHVPGSAVEEAWFEGGRIAALSFTGSDEVGRHLERLARPRGIKVQLELGGKNAVIVAPDADVELAAAAIVRGAFGYAGQKCTATSRAIAIGGIAGPLARALVRMVAALQPGDPVDPRTTLGPVIDDSARRRIAEAVAEACRSGATILASRSVPEVGSFSPPLVLTGVDPTSPIAQREVFGPVLCLFEVADFEAALALHDGVEYGLSGAIFTRDLHLAEEFVTRAQVGVAHVNRETTGAEPHVPFGGTKASSSWSREQGAAAEEFYTQVKTVYVNAAAT